MANERISKLRARFRGLVSALPPPPRITTCVVVYYALLIALGAISNTADPLTGILTILFLTHMFIIVALPAYGKIGVLIIVCVPAGVALGAVSLKGWWRVIGIMGLIVGMNLYSAYSAAQLYG